VRRLTAAIAAIFLSLICSHAVAGDIVSGGPAKLSVTIYRDHTDLGLAFITETRVVDLPAGRSRLRFEGVASGIIPQSVTVKGLPRPVAEQDFDYSLLTPANLIAHAIGEPATLVTTQAKTGREVTKPAVVVSGPDGVVLNVDGRIQALNCGGLHERLVFDHAPAGLTSRPTLSAQVASPAAGRFTVKLSYLTLSLDWAANYIARINPDGRTLNLSAWVTLANHGATGFADARTEVVAGDLSRAPLAQPRIKTQAAAARCWPGQTTHSGWIEDAPRLVAAVDKDFSLNVPAPAVMMLARDAVAAPPQPRPRVVASELGDYKLYTLPEPTTVAAQQTKQVLFLSAPIVKFHTVYSLSVNPYASAAGRPFPAAIVLRLLNKPEEGLGKPLPAGKISLRLPYKDRELLAGEYPLRSDTPVGSPFEIEAGAARDVTMTERLTRTSRSSQSYEIVAANAKTTSVTVEIRHLRGGAPGFKVAAESDPHGLKSGDPLWSFDLPAGARRTLTYTVETQPPR
jgi:hypothetical protein